MNDFTKKELQDMMNWGEVYTEFGNSWTDRIHRPMINKIQSLIDNYCEHEESISCSESIRRHHELDDEECQHESDGLYYDSEAGMRKMNKLLPYHDYFRQKCKKCGEFYR